MHNFTVDTKGASTKDLKHPGPTSNTCGRRSILMGILLRHSWMLMKKIPTFLHYPEARNPRFEVDNVMHNVIDLKSGI